MQARKRLFSNSTLMTQASRLMASPGHTLYHDTPQAHLKNLLLESGDSIYAMDSHGNSPFHHLAAQETITAQEVTQLVSQIGEDAASSMLRMNNNRRLLPSDILRANKHISNKEEILPLFYGCMRHNKTKKLSEPMSVDAMMAANYPSRGERFYRNLSIACEAANEVRRIIRHSNTHPQTNDASLEEQEAILDKIVANRLKLQTDLNQKLIEDQYDYYEQIGVRALNSGHGNCMEFSFAAWNYLNRRYSNISSNVYIVKKGDHAVVGLDLKDDYAFHQNTVFLDPWYGSAFAADEIASGLTSFRQMYTDNVGNRLRVVSSYNERVHRFESEVPSWLIQERRAKQQANLNVTVNHPLGLFSKRKETQQQSPTQPSAPSSLTL